MKIYLYGSIHSYNENSAKAFLERFNEAQNSGEDIDLHIHSIGGEVIEGGMIYNAIRKARVNVNVYVDGLAASMGSVILMAAKKVYMSENAFIMMHAPRGIVFGTAQEMEKQAKALRSMESNFMKVYMARTGKTKQEVEEWLVGDNWFSAEDALALGMIDGIVDKIAEVEPNIDTKETDIDTMYGHYAALLTHNNNKNKPMNKLELIARFGLTGLTEKSSDEDVTKAIEAKIQAEKDKATVLENEKKEAEKKAVEAVVDTAIADGKIKKEQKDAFMKIGEANGIETLRAALPATATKPLPGNITAALQTAAAGGEAVSRHSWDFDKWQKEDPEGLEQLAKDEPEVFQAIYDKKFRRA